MWSFSAFLSTYVVGPFAFLFANPFMPLIWTLLTYLQTMFAELLFNIVGGTLGLGWTASIASGIMKTMDVYLFQEMATGAAGVSTSASVSASRATSLFGGGATPQ